MGVRISVDLRLDQPSAFAGFLEELCSALSRLGLQFQPGAHDRVTEGAVEVGRVVRCHPRDPSWFQWPLLEAVIEGNIVADFPLCNKSFNCSYSGHDL